MSEERERAGEREDEVNDFVIGNTNGGQCTSSGGEKKENMHRMMMRGKIELRMGANKAL